jgi:hypothetical protein
MTLSRKKFTAIAVATAVLLAIGGGAYAYWTLSGSGTGTASTGTVAGSITVNQTSTVTDLRPGGAPQTLSGDFDNSDVSPVYVTSVTVSIDSVVTSPVGGSCDASDYTLTGATMTVDAEIASGSGVGAWTGATIAFNNKAAVNQDDCQGATVNLAYAAN